jgi:hypothetical protein
VKIASASSSDQCSVSSSSRKVSLRRSSAFVAVPTGLLRPELVSDERERLRRTPVSLAAEESEAEHEERDASSSDQCSVSSSSRKVSLRRSSAFVAVPTGRSSSERRTPGASRIRASSTRTCIRRKRTAAADSGKPRGGLAADRTQSKTVPSSVAVEGCADVWPSRSPSPDSRAGGLERKRDDVAPDEELGDLGRRQEEAVNGFVSRHVCAPGRRRRTFNLKDGNLAADRTQSKTVPSSVFVSHCECESGKKHVCKGWGCVNGRLGRRSESVAHCSVIGTSR